MSAYLPDDPFFTAAEIAAIFKIKPKTVYLWVELGKLDAVVVGGRAVRIPRASVEKLIQEKNM